MALEKTAQQTAGKTVSGQSVHVAAPASGAELSVASSPAGELVLGFDPSTATATRPEGSNDLVFELDGGGRVTIADFFVVGDESLPDLKLPDGTVVASADFFEGSGLDMSTAAGASAAPPSSGSDGSGDPLSMTNGLTADGVQDGWQWETSGAGGGAVEAPTVAGAGATAFEPFVAAAPGSGGTGGAGGTGGTGGTGTGTGDTGTSTGDSGTGGTGGTGTSTGDTGTGPGDTGTGTGDTGTGGPGDTGTGDSGTGGTGTSTGDSGTSTGGTGTGTGDTGTGPGDTGTGGPDPVNSVPELKVTDGVFYNGESSFTGNLVDFGADGPSAEIGEKAISFNIDTPPVWFYNGVPVTFEVKSEGGYDYVIGKAGDVDICKLTANADGTYGYEQYQTVNGVTRSEGGWGMSGEGLKGLGTSETYYLNGANQIGKDPGGAKVLAISPTEDGQKLTGCHGNGKEGFGYQNDGGAKNLLSGQGLEFTFLSDEPQSHLAIQFVSGSGTIDALDMLTYTISYTLDGKSYELGPLEQALDKLLLELDFNALLPEGARPVSVEVTPEFNNDGDAIFIGGVSTVLAPPEVLPPDPLEVAFTARDGDGDLTAGGALVLTPEKEGNTTIDAPDGKGYALAGGDEFDTLNGGVGNDILNGGDGDDILFGGLGNDTMTGGEGADVFVWTKTDLDGGTDQITDFTLGQDKIRFEDIFGDQGTLQELVKDGVLAVRTDEEGLQLFMELFDNKTKVQEIQITLQNPEELVNIMPDPGTAEDTQVAILKQLLSNFTG